MAVSLNVGHALVSNTAGNVWTQSVAYGAEVVLSVQTKVVAFDFLVASAVIRTGVVGFVVGQVQRNVVGQEVTDRCAWVVTVFYVLDAVVVLFFVEQFTLDRALALCQGTERSCGYKGTNGNAQGVFQFHPLNPHLVIVKQSLIPGDNSAASLSDLAYT